MAWQPDYVTTAEMKSYLRIEDTADDVLIALWVSTASRAVDDFCGRQFGKTDGPVARTYTPLHDRHQGIWIAEVDDLQDVTDLSVLRGDLVVADYTLTPTNAVLRNRPYERLAVTASGALTITGVWGWTTVPSAVKTATMLQAARFAIRRDSPYGIAGSPSEGSEMRLLATLDPDLRTALGRTYRRTWWAA